MTKRHIARHEQISLFVTMFSKVILQMCQNTCSSGKVLRPVLFFAGELIGVTSTGLDHYVTNSSVPLTRSPEKDVLLIFIHALQNGLFRIHMQGQTGK